MDMTCCPLNRDLVIRLLHDEEQDLHFWFQDMNELGEQYRQRGLYLFAGPVGSGKTTLMHELAKSLFKGQQVMSIEDPVATGSSIDITCCPLKRDLANSCIKVVLPLPTGPANR